MEKNKPYLLKYSAIQSIGLLPLFVVLLINNFCLGEHLKVFSLGIGCVCLGVGLLRWRGYKTISWMWLIASAVLIEFSLLRYLLTGSVSVLSDAQLIGFLLFINLSVLFLFKKKIERAQGDPDILVGTQLRNSTYEFFYIARFFLGGLCIYLVVLTLYNNYGGSSPQSDAYKFFNNILNLILLFSLFVYEVIRYYLLNRELEKEVWLPIVDINMVLEGGVAEKMDSLTPRKYLHPHVRVILLQDNRIYMHRNLKKHSLSGCKIDTPLSDDFHLGEDVEDTLTRLLSRNLSNLDVEPRFIIRSFYDTERMRRIVFHYVVHLPDEKYIGAAGLNNARFWTMEQIQDNLGKDTFSDQFEEEFDFLSSTVFLAMEYNKEKAITRND